MLRPDKAWFVVQPFRLRSLIDLDMRTVPVRWQGWLVTLIAATLIIRVIQTTMPTHWQGGIALIAVVLVGIIALTYMTGRPIPE